MQFIHWLFNRAPEIPLFLSLALGFWFGKINFYKFKFGAVAGSLIFGVLFGLFDVHLSDGLKTFLFAIFIFAVGYESGPTFFSSLGRNTIREILLNFTLFIIALATVVILANSFNLDKGLAAGLAAGALTQSAIIGTANDAISKMGFGPAELNQLQANIASGYAISYVTGSILTIIICVVVLPAFMRRGIREDAISAEMSLKSQKSNVMSFSGNQSPALNEIIGRVYEVGKFIGKTIAEFEEKSCDNSKNFKRYLTIELVRNKNEEFAPKPDYILGKDDQILVVGPRDVMIAFEGNLGQEVLSPKGLQLIMNQTDVVITNDSAVGKLSDVLNRFTHEIRHGAYISRIWKNDKLILGDSETILNKGDVVRFYGLERDINRMASHFGTPLVTNKPLDYLYMSLGIVAGFLIGLLVWKINGTIPLTLGSGGGCLLSGLIFGWFKSRKKTFGEVPQPVLDFMKNIGLAGFIAIVGINSSVEAIHTVQKLGFTLFLLGLVITIVPLIITMIIGKYIFGYKNVAIFAGALAGTRSANPAFGEVLKEAGNGVPTVPFAVTYALANILLTLIGPLVVVLVK